MTPLPGASDSDDAAPRRERQRRRRSPVLRLLPPIYLVVGLWTMWAGGAQPQPSKRLWSSWAGEGCPGGNRRVLARGTRAESPTRRPSMNPHERHDPQPSPARCTSSDYAARVNQIRVSTIREAGMFQYTNQYRCWMDRFPIWLSILKQKICPVFRNADLVHSRISTRPSARGGPWIVRSRPGRSCGYVDGGGTSWMGEEWGRRKGSSGDIADARAGERRQRRSRRTVTRERSRWITRHPGQAGR